MSYPKVSIYQYASGDFRIIRKYLKDNHTTIITKEEFEKMNELNDANRGN